MSHTNSRYKTEEIAPTVAIRARSCYFYTFGFDFDI